MRKTICWASAIPLILTSFACGSTDPAPGAPSDVAQSGEAQMYSVTEVHLNKDAPPTVSVEYVTAAESQRRAQALMTRAAGGMTLDTITTGNCTSSGGAFLYDQICGQGGNEICFSGAAGDSALLHNYCRGTGCSSNWQNNVYAFYGMAEDGHLSHWCFPGPGCPDYFTKGSGCLNPGGAEWGIYFSD